MLLRLECIGKLGEHAPPQVLRSLATSVRDDWEIREALVQALAASVGSDVAADNADLRVRAGDYFSQRLESDPSLKVRAAAIKAIATIRDSRAVDAIREASMTPSQSDALRLAAIDAIKELKPDVGLQILERLTRDGLDGRTRAAAIEALPALAGDDKSPVVNRLIPLLTSREHRPRIAAATALAELGDQRGLGPLQAAADKERAPEIARRLRDQAEKLAKKIAEPASTPN
jgi:HEAT repeat protein